MVELFSVDLVYLPQQGGSVISEDALLSLYSVPNVPGQAQTLAEAIEHWFGMTLLHDRFAHSQGLDPQCLHVKAQPGAPWRITVAYSGDAARSDCSEYGSRCQTGLSSLLTHGASAFFDTIPKLRELGMWDPLPRAPNAKPWRPFLGIGLPLVNQKAVQFFHYPPIRLLEGTQNYLADPVPTRWEHLLWVNGVERDGVSLYESVIDCAPIAADDDQGSGPFAHIPPTVPYFSQYQADQLRALLERGRSEFGVTPPVVAYGGKAVPQFNKLFGTNLSTAQSAAVTGNVIPGRRTAVLGTGHPYNFYYQAQQARHDDDPAHYYVGNGHLTPEVAERGSAAREKVVRIAVDDLVAARWQIRMAAQPDADPVDMLDKCRADCGLQRQDGQGSQWVLQAAGPLRDLAEYLTDYHGSLLYPDYGSSDAQAALRYQYRTEWPEMRHPSPAI
ncbi:hypothetical protein GCM10027277_34620 [Pseudoduganella ginsengisoli]|uniref:Uncharacterized protein n=1 Tax=Pseudoduganella ginsengisoli TaxID=1462440 RepID=A0A6L6Q6X0_9BURK|nr:hypothetical protein [Pseudoduganella ginsengisoli]MTW05593.1 hypothetical protein [Pseudoduganella ginsengisoli]